MYDNKTSAFNFTKKENPTLVFFCKFDVTFEKIFFYRTYIWAIASANCKTRPSAISKLLSKHFTEEKIGPNVFHTTLRFV